MFPIFTDSNLSPEEYAAQWGCDPAYDRAPRQPGDGYLFYNFSVEQDPKFLQRFIPAIKRTIFGAEIAGMSQDDRADLQELLEYVEYLLSNRELVASV